MSRLSVRPVFTAHPTEAARRSVLLKLRAIADLLDTAESDGVGLEDPRVSRRAAELVDLLWQTDELRLERPEVLDETRNALYYLDHLARGPVATVLDDLALALESICVSLPPDARPLSFGSWIGGDRTATRSSRRTSPVASSTSCATTRCGTCSRSSPRCSRRSR